jgi:uncharacterized membrane protein
VPELARALVLVHVISAILYGAGYIGTNLLTEFARRSDEPVTRRNALTFSTRFDRMLNAPGGTVVSLTGLATTWAFGYSFLAFWIAAAIVLWLVLMGLGITYWRSYGKRVDTALSAGDESAVTRVLREPRSVAVSRAENVVFLILVALMVLRPGT